MKKNLLFLTASLFFLYSNCFAQGCTPNLPNGGSHGKLVPDTIVNLPHSTVGVPYSTDIQFYVATDTFAQGFNNTIQNFVLDSVSGMPSGFAYTTNPSNGIFQGGTSDCMNATGNPTAGMEGTYPLVVHVTGHLLINGLLPYTQAGVLTGYKVVIDPDGTVGIQNNTNSEKFELLQNIPNPANDNSRIRFTSVINENIELNLYNTIGQIVLHQNINAEKGLNEVNISTAGFTDGIYFYSIRNSVTTLTSRLVVSKK